MLHGGLGQSFFLGGTKSTYLDVSAFFLVLCESAKLHFPTRQIFEKGW